MGAYSPVPIVDAPLVEEMMELAIRPTLRELAARGASYRGILYAGLMLTVDGPKVLEYNVRFGDPECQVVLPRLDTDLGELCFAAAIGAELPPIRFRPDACVTVVLASGGYPGSARIGDPVHGLEAAAAEPGVVVFHAGTAKDATGAIVTGGGRVLDVTALGSTIGEARRRAYDAAALITWPGMQYRRDIAAAA